MSKFYADGKDDMVIYKFTADVNDPVAGVDYNDYEGATEDVGSYSKSEMKYTRDETVMDMALVSFLRRYANHNDHTYRSDRSITVRWDYSESFVTVCYVTNCKEDVIAKFTLEELHIPNDLFDKMPNTTTNYRFPDNGFVNVPYVPTSHLRGTAAPSGQADVVTTLTNSVTNTNGSQIGSYNASTSADAIRAVKSPNFVETFNVANFFGNFSRVPVADRDKYNAALTEAEKTYGDYIVDFIVPDASKLTKAQCKDIVKEYDEIKKSVETPGDCIPVVFDLATYSTKVVTGYGAGPTIY